MPKLAQSSHFQDIDNCWNRHFVYSTITYYDPFCTTIVKNILNVQIVDYNTFWSSQIGAKTIAMECYPSLPNGDLFPYLKDWISNAET